MEKMNKNESVKDFFTDRISQDLNIDRSIVQKVIDFQGRDIIKAFVEFNSVEISGLGRFTFNNGKSLKKLKKYEKELELTLKRIENNEYKTEEKRQWDERRKYIYENAIAKIKKKNSML